MSFESPKWILALPAVFFIHDLEELAFINKIFSSSAILPRSIQGLINITPLQFAVAVSLLFIEILLATILWNRKPSSPPRALIMGFMLVGLFFNGVTHIGQALFFWQYIPGVVTSVLLLLPYTFVILKSQHTKFFSSNKTAWLVLLGVLAFTPVIIIVSLLFAKIVMPV